MRQSIISKSLLIMIAFWITPLLDPNYLLSQFSQEEVKAAYLLNFGKFVDWPASALQGTSQNFTICIIGADPFREKLDLILRDQKIKDRTPEVIRVSSPGNLPKCQIAYISTDSQERISQALARLKSSHTLTVSDYGDFTSMGGMIQFKLEGERLRFKINLAAAESAGLKISSKLLRLSEVTR